MRVALALAAALAAALPVAAQAADGPLGAIQRSFGWAFGREPEPAPAPQPLATGRPEAMPLADQFVRGRTEAPEPARLPPPPARYRAAAAPPYQMFTPQVPLPLQTQRMAAAPASLYPAAPIAGQPPVRAVAQQAAPAASPPPPPPMVLAAAPERLAAPAAPRSVGGATRLYSVHRGYGLEPDAIPEGSADNRYVLIGPSASGVGAQDQINADDAPDSRPGAF